VIDSGVAIDYLHRCGWLLFFAYSELCMKSPSIKTSWGSANEKFRNRVRYPVLCKVPMKQKAIIPLTKVCSA